jgi:hypothetical protein
VQIRIEHDVAAQAAITGMMTAEQGSAAERTGCEQPSIMVNNYSRE